VSLINEALKRARQESRRREALAKGLPLATPPRPTPHRSWLTAAVVAMALALLLSLVTIARLATDEPARTAAATTGSASTDAPTGSNQDEAFDTDAEGKNAKAAAIPVPGERESAATPPSTLDSSRLVADEPDQATLVPAPEAARVEASTVSEPLLRQPVADPDTESRAGLAALPAEGVGLEPSTGSSDDEGRRIESPSQPRIFVERMTLSSGEVLELGGIAWSESGPYALLDERVVGLGESIMGYIVTRIAPQEVELQGGEGTILIRLK
jgi:hypothetical protein